MISAFCAGLSAFATVSPISAEDTSEKANPFQHIVERNVFALKPPPPPPDPNDQPPPPPAPLAKVILTGILNVLGPPRALLEVTEVEAGKQPAGQPKKPILREGEKDGSIEVISIDVEKNVVRIKNGNVETNLTFEVAKQGAGPAPAGTPNPTLPGYNAAATMPGAAGAPDNNSGRRAIVAGANPANPNTPANPPPLGNAAGLQLPQRQIRSSAVPGQNATVDPVAQWVQMKAEEERNRQNASRAKIPPPPLPTPPPQ